MITSPVMQITIGGASQIEPAARSLVESPETNFRLPNQAQLIASAIEIPAAPKLNASYFPGSMNNALNAVHRNRIVSPKHNHRIRSVAHSDASASPNFTEVIVSFL